MPIVTKNNKVIYGRNEVVPRPAKKQQQESSDELTPEQQAVQNTAWNAFALIKEAGYFLILIIAVVLTQYKRTDGLLSTANSVMSSDHAESYSYYLTANTNQISITPLQNTAESDRSGSNTQRSEPICNHNDLAYLSSQISLTYSLKQQHNAKFTTTANEAISETALTERQEQNREPENEVKSETPSTEIASSTTPITFTLKSPMTAIHTGSTLPLLHLAAAGMCVNQTKVVRLDEPSFLPPEDASFRFTPTSAQFLTTVFPSFAQGPRGEKISTIQLPIELELTVVNVVSENAMQLKLQQEEQERLRQGDFNAFIRALFGKINPLFLFIGYVGVRFGMMVFKRIKTRKFVMQAAGMSDDLVEAPKQD